MYRKAREQTIRCQKCGRPIKFVKNFSNHFVPVDPAMGYYIPDDALGTSLFVTKHGEVRKGRRGRDGMEGYPLHKCVGKPTEGR